MKEAEEEECDGLMFVARDQLHRHPDRDRKDDDANADSGQMKTDDGRCDDVGVFREGMVKSSRIWVFVVVLCALSFVEGISVNGLPYINISSLEKRFELKSSQTGLIASSGDIGAICLVLIVSFYGGRSHRPRVMAAGGFLLCLGCLLFLLPHVIQGPYTISTGSDDIQTCEMQGKTAECQQSVLGTRSASRLLPFFLAGQTLQGIGFTPAFTCGFAYIDDHATSEDTAVYIGVTYAITALGVGVGYVVGGQLLSLWVDIGRANSTQISISPDDKRWVGAWWIGYAICCILYFMVSIILCLFPRYLAGSKTLWRRQQTIKEDKYTVNKPKRPKEQSGLINFLLSFPRALFDLVRNPLYILLVLVGAGDTLIVSGIAGFAPKIVEEKFNIQPTESGLIMGAVTLVGGAGGMALGGFLIRKFHLKLMGIMKMSLIFILAGGVLGGSCFFIQCPKQRFAGLNSVYGLEKQVSRVEGDLNADCNSNCSCSTAQYEPVCGQDGVTYFSGCYAGCPGHKYNKTDGQQTFDNCLCIMDTLRSRGNNGSGSASSGECAGRCVHLWPFVFLMFLGIFFTFLNVTPMSMAILRCVPVNERSVSLGLQWVTLRLLGTIPGPILTGAVLDTTCMLWQNTCNGPGNCWVYDRSDMSLRLFLWWVAVKISALFFLLLAYCFYNKNGHAEVDRQEGFDQSMQLSNASAANNAWTCENDTRKSADHPSLATSSPAQVWPGDVEGLAADSVSVNPSDQNSSALKYSKWEWDKNLCDSNNHIVSTRL